MAGAPHDVIAVCPVCNGELLVTRLHCAECGTTLEGRFGVGRFARLDRDQMAVLESFLRARGNLREMERELGISYPTVRNRVEALVRALGFAPDEGATPGTSAPAAPPAAEPRASEVSGVSGPMGASRPPVPPDAGFVAAERRRVLERLARHELTPEDAAAILRALGGVEGATDG